MKKVFKIIGITLFVIIILLIAAPFIFESQLKDMVKKTINNNVNAQVEFSDLNLSFFRSFPQATLVLDDVSVINNAPFKGDTLALSKEIMLEMSIKEIFKGSDKPKKIDKLQLNGSYVNILIDSLGNTNYDIAKESPTTSTDTTSTSFKLDLQHYEINNSKLRYTDKQNHISLLLQELNHQGTGDFSLDQSNLDTHTNTLISLNYGGNNYLDKNKLALDAVIQMDLVNLKYTFLENSAKINQLPLTFDGYVKVNDNNNEMDISFKTPSSSFKNFLQVIPETYAKNVENVDTQGDFVLNGRINGIVDDTHIPKMDIKITSSNASFKYPDLPKSVQDINIDMQVLNTTGLAADTYVDLNKFSFKIDQDAFSGHGKIRNLTANMVVDLALNGTVNLANLEKAYPLKLDQDLSGVLTADVTTSFDMNSIEKEQYQNVNSKGTASIRNFSYKSPEIPNKINIANASMNFNQGNVKVPELLITTGKSDMEASGNINNLIGFLFTDQQLKGTFDVKSKTFAVNDFMIAKTTSEADSIATSKTQTTTATAVKIPSFLDVQLNFAVNNLIYDDLTLNNAKGTVIIKDEKAILQNITTNIFDGSLALNGDVSTKNKVPTFSMNLDMNSLDIAKSFNGLDLLHGLAPIAQALQGKLQTQINLSGNLNDDLTPQLNSIVGQALAQILTAKVDPEKLALLSQLDEKLKFINLNDINLDNLKSKLTFNNGMVEVAPFDFNVKGINVNVSGSHGFDMQMNYKVTLDIPAKMLGSEIGSTLSKLSAQDLNNMIVPLPIGLTGTFQKPNINLNMQQAITNLTQQIVAEQKKELTKKGVDALGNILSGGSKNKTNDSTATPDQMKKDSVKNEQETQVKNAAKTILGNILKNKTKKQDTTKKE